MTKDTLTKMFEAIDARLDLRQTWDTNQQAIVLSEAGFSKEEIDEFFEEISPF